MSAGSFARICFALVFDKVKCLAPTATGKDNGFGNNYIWAGSLESGVQMAANHKMPAMIIIYKPLCPACKNLKPKIAGSQEIQTLSKHFVMINLEEGAEAPKTPSYAPDGNYVPRILFLSPEGLIDQDIYNENGSNQHKYFYSRPEQIAQSMKKALEKYKNERFDV
ncbi:hypothetical protein JYU34_005044 [Plutella xylostella]|uniref:Uncharacterized protein n=2 Tax=Plutella xylostella TaxID=51655 RepID=A0ABQ7QVP6_PLUXY|nr:hypothetical protein JYU34_005044 [Plutella xylostella]CAG9112578.1 unnamed protein product [Plutella xylostella]